MARVNQDLSDNEAAWSECLRRLPLAQDYVQSAVLGKALLALPSRLRSNRRLDLDAGARRGRMMAASKL